MEDKKRLKRGAICEAAKAGVQEVKCGDSIYIIAITWGWFVVTIISRISSPRIFNYGALPQI